MPDSPDLSAVRRFSPSVDSVREVRRFVDETTAELAFAGREIALLLASELATNAVVHCGHEFTVSVGHDDGTLRVEVADGCGDPPVVLSPGPDVLRGRGLRIVDGLAASWGVAERRDGEDGKSVWFSLPID